MGQQQQAGPGEDRTPVEGRQLRRADLEAETFISHGCAPLVPGPDRHRWQRAIELVWHLGQHAPDRGGTAPWIIRSCGHGGVRQLEHELDRLIHIVVLQHPGRLGACQATGDLTALLQGRTGESERRRILADVAEQGGPEVGDERLAVDA